RAFFFSLFKAQRARADCDAIAIFQWVFEFLLAVNKYFVSAALDLAVDHNTVDDRERAVIVGTNVRVVSRGARVIQHNLIVGCAANHAEPARIEFMLRLASGGVSDFQSSHMKYVPRE